MNYLNIYIFISSFLYFKISLIANNIVYMVLFLWNVLWCGLYPIKRSIFSTVWEEDIFCRSFMWHFFCLIECAWFFVQMTDYTASKIYCCYWRITYCYWSFYKHKYVCLYIYNLNFENFSSALNFGRSIPAGTMLRWYCVEINSHIGLLLLLLLSRFSHVRLCATP